MLGTQWLPWCEHHGHHVHIMVATSLTRDDGCSYGIGCFVWLLHCQNPVSNTIYLSWPFQPMRWHSRLNEFWLIFEQPWCQCWNRNCETWTVIMLKPSPMLHTEWIDQFGHRLIFQQARYVFVVQPFSSIPHFVVILGGLKTKSM